MSTPKARSLAVAVPLGAVMVVSAMLAIPWLASTAYATTTYNPCEKDPYSDKCKKFCKDYPDKCKKEDNKKKYPVCHNGKQIYVGSKNAQYKHMENHYEPKYCPKKPSY
jgi:hypothetical protein